MGKHEESQPKEISTLETLIDLKGENRRGWNKNGTS
jgi:hypothetical protein